jgi:sugar phosphate isomerase/epimerase
MKLGISVAPDKAAILPPGAVDFIEVNVQTFLVPLENDAAFAPKMEVAAGCSFPIYSANGFLPGNLKSTGPEVDAGRIEAYAARAFERASRLGIKIIVFGSGGSRQVPEGFSHDKAREQFVGLLQRLGPMAADRGVTLVLEPLGRGECNFIHTVVEGAQIVREVNHSHIRLLADFFHMMRNDEDPASLEGVVPLLAHAHVAEKAKRTAPGVDGDDFRPFLEPLRRGQYPGALALECGFTDMVEETSKAVRVLREQGA